MFVDMSRPCTRPRFYLLTMQRIAFSKSKQSNSSKILSTVGPWGEIPLSVISPNTIVFEKRDPSHTVQSSSTFDRNRAIDESFFVMVNRIFSRESRRSGTLEYSMSIGRIRSTDVSLLFRTSWSRSNREDDLRMANLVWGSSRVDPSTSPHQADWIGSFPKKETITHWSVLNEDGDRSIHGRVPAFPKKWIVLEEYRWSLADR